MKQVSLGGLDVSGGTACAGPGEPAGHGHLAGRP